MSVTFHTAIEAGDLLGWEVVCRYGEEDRREFHAGITYDEARDRAVGDPMWPCCGMEHHGVEARYVGGPRLNVANSNAAELLDLLGYDARTLYGEADPDDLLGRVLVAAALAPDVALPAVEETGANGARLIDLGRPAGYIPAKLARLQLVCADAKARGRQVVWG